MQVFSFNPHQIQDAESLLHWFRVPCVFLCVLCLNWAQVGVRTGAHKQIHMSTNDLETTLRAYLACALWSSTDNADESGGEPLDANYSIEDIAPESVEAARADIVDFLGAVAGAGIDRSAWDAEQMGHDFWLTRNGHGAGFWDRADRENGRKLTDLCKQWGTSDAYVGDDGKIHLT